MGGLLQRCKAVGSVDSSCACYSYQHPQRWILATALICLYGFFKSMRPSEPFLTAYLIKDKNITETELNNVVFPYWTYSYMIALVPVFLYTDLLRYKPVVVFEAITYIGTWAIILFGQGIPQMIVMQCLYGMATATEIAYYSYTFAAVPAAQFQRVSSYTRSALLTGNFIAAALSQLLISLKATTYFGLNIISMSSVACSLVIAIALPTVRQTLYFHRGARENGENNRNIATAPEDTDVPVSTVCQASFMQGCRENFTYMWQDFKNCYGNVHLLKWSLWWAFATCGYFQVGNYVQNLWQIIYEKPGYNNSNYLNNDQFNGAVEAISTLTGAISAFLIMFVSMDWRLFGELLLGLVCLVESGLLVVMGTTSNIWLCYVFYIIFRSSYQLVITIATYQIAKHLSLERYALVFGMNMFIALALGSTVTFIVVDSRILNTPADTQFIIYGGYFFVLSCAFNGKAVYSLTAYGWRSAWRERHGDTRPTQQAQTPQAVLVGEGESPKYHHFNNESDTGESDV